MMRGAFEWLHKDDKERKMTLGQSELSLENFVTVDIFAGQADDGQWYVTVSKGGCDDIIVQYGPFDQKEALRVHADVFKRAQHIAERLGGHVVQGPTKRLDS